jgi:hypothetical protein
VTVVTGVELNITISQSKFDEIRRWVNRFMKDHGALERFWWKVGLYYTKNGSFPKVNDILWGMFNEERGNAFARGEAGVYCGITMWMCDLLHHEERFEAMMLHACQFTAMQSAGARNGDPDCPFDPRFAMVGSKCAPSIYYAAKGCGLGFPEVRPKFLNAARAVFDDFGVKEPDELAESAWLAVSEKLSVMFSTAPPMTRSRVTQPRFID